jgi:hypothetical protein
MIEQLKEIIAGAKVMMAPDRYRSFSVGLFDLLNSICSRNMTTEANTEKPSAAALATLSATDYAAMRPSLAAALLGELDGAVLHERKRIKFERQKSRVFASLTAGEISISEAGTQVDEIATLYGR